MKNYDALVIGSGCAGFNAADWLYDLGVRNIVLLTEGIQMGTSRNTGSDKQTYYKLSLAGDTDDSVHKMSKTLFAGGGIHGDTALTEAGNSVKSFMKLVNLGVPFPTNIYGEHVGYKTDHDPEKRGTSLGPLTSRIMTEALETSVINKNIKIIDNCQAVKILLDETGKQVTGLLTVDTVSGEYDMLKSSYIIVATGGPAGAYYDSVYPVSQTGATGLLVQAGVKLSNISEWQYGLASTKFRWNVSGTYQQVLPKYISVDKKGNQREFLLDYFDDPQEALDMVFLKGYQWPFDSAKVNGSSRIDVIIHKETKEKGNRVFMDFRSEPTGLSDGFKGLSKETYEYLKNSDALIETPIKRLEKMNKKAIELYRDNGIDLYKEPLEVKVCAQHCNGGADVDINYETNIKGLYAVGEVAGVFGVYRPGGTALNSTQTGSMRAAEHIARMFKEEAAEEREIIYDLPIIEISLDSNLMKNRIENQKLMSKYCGFRRNLTEMKKLFDIFKYKLENFHKENRISNKNQLPMYYKNRDILLTQISMLSAMIFSAEKIGSRGGSLVEGKEPTNDKMDKTIVTKDFASEFENVRPLPESGGWFENVWNEYNERMGLV